MFLFVFSYAALWCDGIYYPFYGYMCILVRVCMYVRICIYIRVNERTYIYTPHYTHTRTTRNPEDGYDNDDKGPLRMVSRRLDRQKQGPGGSGTVYGTVQYGTVGVVRCGVVWCGGERYLGLGSWSAYARRNGCTVQTAVFGAVRVAGVLTPDFFFSRGVAGLPERRRWVQATRPNPTHAWRLSSCACFLDEMNLLIWICERAHDDAVNLDMSHMLCNFTRSQIEYK